MSTREPFDAFEVHKVGEFQHPMGELYCETIDTPEEQADADLYAIRQFWTVYGHRSWPEHGDPRLLSSLVGVGLTAVADLDNPENARDLAYALAATGNVEVHLA